MNFYGLYSLLALVLYIFWFLAYGLLEESITGLYDAASKGFYYLLSRLGFNSTTFYLLTFY